MLQAINKIKLQNAILCAVTSKPTRYVALDLHINSCSACAIGLQCGSEFSGEENEYYMRFFETLLLLRESCRWERLHSGRLCTYCLGKWGWRCAGSGGYVVLRKRHRGGCINGESPGLSQHAALADWHVEDSSALKPWETAKASAHDLRRFKR